MAPLTLTAQEAEVVSEFEDCTLPPGSFHHREHLLVAWWYLGHAPFLVAATRFAQALRRYAEAVGATTLYNATITLCFLALIHERMADSPPGFDAFLERFPELLDGKALLRRHGYDDATLDSDVARAGLVLPRPRTP